MEVELVIDDLADYAPWHAALLEVGFARSDLDKIMGVCAQDDAACVALAYDSGPIYGLFTRTGEKWAFCSGFDHRPWQSGDGHTFTAGLVPFADGVDAVKDARGTVHEFGTSRSRRLVAGFGNEGDELELPPLSEVRKDGEWTNVVSPRIAYTRDDYQAALANSLNAGVGLDWPWTVEEFHEMELDSDEFAMQLLLETVHLLNFDGLDWVVIGPLQRLVDRNPSLIRLVEGRKNASPTWRDIYNYLSERLE